MTVSTNQIIADAPSLNRTALYDAHVHLGARIVPFAGYEMPVQYPTGILTEHVWTRENAGLFDVSHMGQAYVTGASWEELAHALEQLIPADVLNLKPFQQRYSQLLNAEGGILDDIMITRIQDNTAHNNLAQERVYLVVNAGTKHADYAHIQANLPKNIILTPHDDLALFALQGPKSEAVLASLTPDIQNLNFMTSVKTTISGVDCHISRSGYTGEDGFELSVPSSEAAHLWELLLRDIRVKPIGLGARDSLRLEAGLCLYGHDINETTSPIEARLAWSIQKRRRLEGGFLGAARVQSELENSPTRVRVGLKLEGRAPAREGAIITDQAGAEVGIVTSGGFSPTLNVPIAMGYVNPHYAVEGTSLNLIVRSKPLIAHVCTLPFVANRFKRS